MSSAGQHVSGGAGGASGSRPRSSASKKGIDSNDAQMVVAVRKRAADSQALRYIYVALLNDSSGSTNPHKDVQGCPALAGKQ